jgi:DNA-directed RNA polymerase subunit RPC12/RpoP
MAIKLQCSSCGKKIEAPDSAGGKWGKCPKCHTKIYVPLPPADDDELKLAPIDETEEQKQKQLMLETYRLTQDILEEKSVPEAPGTVGPVPEINEETLTNHLIHYLRQMANGDLDNAQRTADLIVPHRRKAAAILDSLAKSYPPDPELEDIPPQVLSGLIRNLRTRLS